jgi:hypothetical protein
MAVLALLLPLVQQFTVAPAPEWDAAFARTSGWTGADGIHSIPFDGDERAGGLARSATLFLFSDTFIGEVTPDGRRQHAKMVNNTVALLPAAGFPAGLRFDHGGTAAAPTAVFTPATPAALPGEWYWPHDGIALDGAVHFFAHRFRRSSEGMGFARAGLAAITLLPGSRPPFADAVQRDCPFYAPATAQRGETSFGCAILANTLAAGAPHPDGWLYVTGVREAPFDKRLLLARVRPEALLDWSAWRFWDGAVWHPDPAAAISVADRVSPEHSITPLDDGRFLLVYQADTISRVVAARIGDAPQGPYGVQIDLYVCPTPAQPAVWTYNAKAHPHLSGPRELLVSYHVNPTDFWDNFAHADAYRPRFIRVRW